MLKKLALLLMISVSLHAETFNMNTSQNKVVAKKKIPLTKVIIVTGYGIDKTQALKSAFKSAVEQYVGVVVDADTIIKNDEIIKDEILTASNGYIQEYKELSTNNNNGLTEIKIKATVKSQKVFNKIESLNIATMKLVGFDTLYTQVKSQQSRKETKVKNEKAKTLTQTIAKKDAEKILKKTLNKFFSKESLKDMLSITIESVKPNSKELNDNKVPVDINFTISFNAKTYKQKLTQLGQTFDNLGANLHEKIDFPYIKYNLLNVKLKYKVEKLLATDIGLVTEYGKDYRLDVWEFPKNWINMYPFTDLKSLNLYKSFSYVLEVKKKNGDYVFSDKFNFSGVHILARKIDYNTYLSKFSKDKAKIIAPIFSITTSSNGVRSSFSIVRRIWLDVEDIKDLDVVSVVLEAK